MKTQRARSVSPSRRSEDRRSPAPAIGAPVRAPVAATRAECAIAFLVLFLMTKAVIMLALTKGDPLALGLADGSMLYQVLAATAYLVCAIAVLRRPHSALDLLRDNKLLVMLVFVAALSIVWSVNPAITARRVIGLLGSLTVALFLATRFSAIALLRLLELLFITLAVLSLGAVVIVPDLAIHTDIHAGAWRGVFTHKNNLGEAMAMGFALSALLLKRRERRLRSLVGLIACGALLTLSSSRASWVAAAVGILAIQATSVLSLTFWVRIPVMVTLTTLAVVGGTGIWLNIERLLELVGRDLTLTGRTVLWASAIVAGLDRPWLGHGYRAFWLGDSGGVAGLGSDASAFAMRIDHGHNGFLDIWLELGVVGFTLFIAMFAAYAWRSVALARITDAPEGRWPLVLFVLLLPVSFATTVILDRNNYYWIIFVATLLYASRTRLNPSHSLTLKPGVRSGHA